MERPVLRRLADRLGILPAYDDIYGQRRVTPDTTRVALIAAMGFDASSEAAAGRALEAIERRDRERILAPAYVLPARSRRGVTIEVGLPSQALEGRPDYELELRPEEGEVVGQRGRLGVAEGGGAGRIALKATPGPGYHQLTLKVESPEGPRVAEAALILTPPRCPSVGERLGGDRKAFGLWSNLYAVRSARNWGAGDCRDLGNLLEWTAREGGAFVGINPLHALRNGDGWISPYGPVSRLFRNALYLDVESVPELAGCQTARARLASSAFRRELSRLRGSARVDYPGVMALKMPLLEELHEVFVAEHAEGASRRGSRYHEYLRRKGDALTHFATFLALEEHFREKRGEFVPWDRWPDDYRRPGSKVVEDFRTAHQRRVDFHRYVQFELDRQLADVAERGRAAGLPIGIYADVAISTSGDGCDPWAYPDLFRREASVGAPPDDYTEEGQNWGLPPVDPRALREQRYAYWIDLLRNTLEHAGAVRLDHAMALTRLFWIPAGRPASEGAYVRYPTRDLMGVLALESQRNGTLIIAEDLGTVPEGFRARLERWGILSYQVLYFQRDASGAFVAADEYSPRSLVTATTHDHPPLAGFWRGRDLELRREIGDIPDDDRLARARRDREATRRALLDRLAADGLLTADERKRSAWTAEKCAAVHEFLAGSPSPLLGIALDDLAGETEPVNLPGVGGDRFASWSRKARLTLEELRGEPLARRVLDAVAPRRALPHGP